MKLAFGIALAASVLVVGCSGSKQEGAAPGGSSSKPGKKIVVGFSQIGAESGWRTANTESIKSEAAKRGIELRFSDAQQKQEN
ncbi:MAG: LacI family transcriptional regulator, partial [Armatimonadetes bacterium]|nr:LacI family transcriptional regulator [Armatimonadota bacterium]